MWEGSSPIGCTVSTCTMISKTNCPNGLQLGNILQGKMLAPKQYPIMSRKLRID